MASYTIAQLKTAVAAIPNAANTWTIEVPDDLVLPVADSRSVDEKGTLWITIRGYVDFAKRAWNPVT